MQKFNATEVDDEGRPKIINPLNALIAFVARNKFAENGIINNKLFKQFRTDFIDSNYNIIESFKKLGYDLD